MIILLGALFVVSTVTYSIIWYIEKRVKEDIHLRKICSVKVPK